MSTEFIVGCISLVIQSRCVLSNHPHLWSRLPVFNPLTYLSSDPRIISGVNRALLSDPVMLFSSVVSAAALILIYHRGRREQLHLPTIVLSCLSTAIVYSIGRLPLDVLVFVYFPWTLFAGLFVSGQWEVFVREKGEMIRAAERAQVAGGGGTKAD